MIDYRTTGNRRKQLVRKLAELLGEDAKYLGMPSMAFTIAGYTVSKDGQVSPDLPEDIIASLEAAGFVGEAVDDPEPTGLIITLPRDDINDRALENFIHMTESKGALIEAAFDLDALPISYDDSTLKVRWFEDVVLTAEEVHAATELITAMLEKCKSQKHVSAKPVAVDNPKYNFRVWLNSLGFIGQEHKALRKELLKNLEGSSAFRHQTTA